MKLIVFQNSVIDGVSGGNIRFIEIAKRISILNMVVVTSRIGRELDVKRGLKVNYAITTRERIIASVFLLYLERILKGLALNLKLCNDDILYTTSDFLTDVIPALFCKLRNRKLRWIQTIHHRCPSPFKRKGGFINNFFGYFSQQISFLLIRNCADVILVLNSPEGEIIKQYFVDKGYDKTKITRIRNGVDFDFIQTSIRNVKKTHDAVFVGRLTSFKGIFDLIQIWKLVCEQKPNASLVIIGSGSGAVEEKVRKNILENNLEKNVILAGHVDDNEFYMKIGECKMGIHPSYEEGWSIAICEELACGLPVVAWNLPVYHMLYPEGLLRVPIGNLAECANSVLSLLNDPAYSNELSKKALKAVSEYNWNQIAEHELKIIRRAANNSLSNDLVGD